MKLKMARVQIVGLKSQLIPTVQVLHHLGCIEIEDLSELADISARPLNMVRETVQMREDLAFLATKVEGLISTLSTVATNSALLKEKPSPEQTANEECLQVARAGIEELGPQVKTLVSQREKLEADQLSLPRYETTLRKLLPVVPPAAHEPDNVFVGVLVSRAHLWVLDALVEEVLELTGGRAEMATEDIDENTRAMLIVVPKVDAGKVEMMLSREDISRLRLPEEIAHQSLDTAVLSLSQRLAAIPKALAEIETELTTLAQVWLPRLEWWASCLRDQLDEIDALVQLGETDQTFVLAGWVMEKEIPHLCQRLAEHVGDEVVVQRIPLSKADRGSAPIVLKNPTPARPFQSLVSLFSIPSYEGIDPTILMALFMPLFFGMILGDIGYGALLMLISFVGLHRFKESGATRDIIKVVLFGSLWSIVFGFLYGEFFGNLGEELGLHPLWFDRASAEEVTALLLLSLAVGVVHITLGLLLGVWEALRERSRNHLLERGGMLVGLIGLFMIVAVLANRLPAGFMNPAAAILLLGIVLLSVPLGWLGVLLGPIEFIGLIGNILSYLRIAAIGLASVYLAYLANEVAGVMGSIVVGIILAVLIHALNLVMGAFSPTIHSLRLHYVEFFRKFYEGGGRPFAPFQSRRAKRLRTQDV